MSRGLNWDKARRHGKAGTRTGNYRPDGGPTGPQQKLIAKLCRELGLDYERPLTAAEASRQIDSLLGMAKRRRNARKPSPRQLTYVANLRRKLGVTRPPPTTFAEAHDEIARLKIEADRRSLAQREQTYRRKQREARHRRQASAVKHPGSSPSVETGAEHPR